MIMVLAKLTHTYHSLDKQTVEYWYVHTMHIEHAVMPSVKTDDHDVSLVKKRIR